MYCDFKKTSKMKWHFKIPINFIEDTGTLVSLCKKKKKKKLKIGARVCLNIFTDVRCVTVDDWNEFIMQP